MSEFRDYRYISKQKVDLYFQQIEPSLIKKLSMQLQINVGLFKAEFSKRDEPDTLISRLKVVEKHIDDNYNVGTVDNPSRYFRGRMPLVWGEIEPQRDGKPTVIYFGGDTEKTSFGLGGSRHHVIGHGGGNTFSGGSCAPFLIEALNAAQKRNESLAANVETLPRQTPTDYDDRQLALNYVEGEAVENGMHFEHLNFLARTFFVREENGRKTVLGSPIYVSAV